VTCVLTPNTPPTGRKHNWPEVGRKPPEGARGLRPCARGRGGGGAVFRPSRLVQCSSHCCPTAGRWDSRPRVR
jgi:hypothetical protein